MRKEGSLKEINTKKTKGRRAGKLGSLADDEGGISEREGDRRRQSRFEGSH